MSKLAKANLVLNLNHTASQLFQVASQRADQRGLLWMASKRLGSPSQVGQKSETVAWTRVATLSSLYWFKSLFIPVARTLFRQGKWVVSLPESCVFHKDNFNFNATYGVVILSDKSFAALLHFVQIIQVLRNISHKGKVLHLLWDEILTLTCIFFHEVSNFLT